MEGLMTVYELAKVAGVSVRTIQKIAKKLYPKKIKERVKTLFNEKESINILRYVKKRNNVYYDFIKL